MTARCDGEARTARRGQVLGITNGWAVVRGRFANNQRRTDHVSGSLYAYDDVKAGQVAIIEGADGVIHPFGRLCGVAEELTADA